MLLLSRWSETRAPPHVRDTKAAINRPSLARGMEVRDVLRRNTSFVGGAAVVARDRNCDLNNVNEHSYRQTCALDSAASLPLDDYGFLRFIEL